MPLARHDVAEDAPQLPVAVSTHMPLARHDVAASSLLRFNSLFLLTCLLRGMTLTDTEKALCASVSTHMPLARHDVGKSDS